MMSEQARPNHERSERTETQTSSHSRYRSCLSWAARLLGASHLTLLIAWWTDERALVAKAGLFNDYAEEVSGWINAGGAFFELGWLIGSCMLLSGRWLRIGAITSTLGLAGSLASLPPELISASDQILLVATSLLILGGGERLRHHVSVVRWGAWLLFLLWAWTSFSELLSEEMRVWRWGGGLKFWGWTDAAPTPLTIPLQRVSWLRDGVGVLLVSGLAWGPLFALCRVRLWPLLWLIITPLALSLGEGLPSWSGTALIALSLFILDERTPKGLGARVGRWLNARFTPTSLISRLFSSGFTLGFPIVICLSWLSLTSHLGSAPLVVLGLWLMWLSGDDQSVGDDQGAKLVTETPLSMIALLLWGIVISAQLTAQGWGPLTSGSWARRWLPFSTTQNWTHIDRTRQRLIIELSEDHGASWRTYTPQELTSVTRESQPWRPLSPLRYERWYHSLNRQLEAEEGPLMELLERLLRDRIFALRDAGQTVNLQAVLVRVRRERWVRTLHGFWRAEGRGIFSINTNLPVLLKARASVRDARNSTPEMPKLIEETD